MNQVISFLSLRCRQAYRLLNETGITITLIAIFLLTGTILGFIEKALQVNPVYSIIATSILIFTIDNFRKDKNFIIKVFGSKTNAGYYLFIEYGIVILPLILYKLIVEQYLVAIGIVLSAYIVSHISTYLSKPLNQGYKKGLNFIQLKYFELKFFAEKRKILFSITIMLILAGVVHVSLWVLGIFLMMSLILEMFLHQEPPEMIRWKNGFVRSKILDYILVAAPLLLLSGTTTYFNSNLSAWVFVYGALAIVVSISLGISYKYSEYTSFTEKQPSSIPMTIMVFLMILPGFILVTIIYSLIKYNKAEKQMKQLCSK